MKEADRLDVALERKARDCAHDYGRDCICIGAEGKYLCEEILLPNIFPAASDEYLTIYWNLGLVRYP